MFDTQFDDVTALLSEEEFDNVFYASTRMLHAWEQPAWIRGQAFIDVS